MVKESQTAVHVVFQFVHTCPPSNMLQAGMRWLESAYPDRARGWVGFNVPMSHKITAACDLLLMPSRFEPCGLNQLYAMRYGTVPVAHATGGLRDTVLPFNPWEGDTTASPLLMASRTLYVQRMVYKVLSLRYTLQGWLSQLLSYLHQSLQTMSVKQDLYKTSV